MFAFDIIIKNNKLNVLNKRDYEGWINLSSSYVFHLERTGQILRGSHKLVVKNNEIIVSVMCPEIDSYKKSNCTKYNLDVLSRLEKTEWNTIEFKYRGRDIENLNYEIPKNSSSYILRYGWESPLLCGDSHSPIPLYKIPYTDHNGVDYDNLYFFNQDYERLYGLWLSSGSYESFAEEELQNIESSINKRGRELCAIIENLTGIPTYYFLFNYRSWTKEEDKKRKCPISDQKWFIEGSNTSDFISFKCNRSRLVSELSGNTV